MPKRNEPQLTPEEQLKRFQQAAKEPEIKKVVSQIECAFDAPAEKRPKTEGRPHEGSAETDPPRQLILRGSRVETDAEGNVSLNDLWKIAGEPANKRARDWRRYAGAKSLMAALVKRIVGITHNSSEDTEKKLFFSTGKGVAAKTFAHPVLALAYAETLEDDLGVEVRQTFLRYKANDLTLALEIFEGMVEQTEYDELRIKLRRLVKDHNIMSAGVAKEAGVKNFEAYNGAGLSGLYGGMTKAELLKHKKLPPDADRLEHANHEELAANYFKATQAIAKLKRDTIKGAGCGEPSPQ